MRANSASFCTSSSSNAAMTGDISVSTFCICLSFIVDVQMPKTICARLYGRPASSSAAMVLANVGAALSATMAAMLARYSSMPRKSAGLMSATAILSNGGTVHAVSIGCSFIVVMA